MKKLNFMFFLFALGLLSLQTSAWPGMPLPPLHVEGRYLKDNCGNNVSLHGVAITPSPWFNGCQYGFDSQYCTWTNYDVQGALDYNNAVMDKLTDTADGWHLNYIRLHIDPYWTNDPGSPIPENDISRFNYDRLVTYTDQVIVPLINHARERGMYVILRPPGVCPERIAVNDAYHDYLKKVWTFLSQHPGLKNVDNVMFELANEPVKILGTNGEWGSAGSPYYEALHNFFQPVVDIIRNNGANNICWLPGTGWQSHYLGYVDYPITGGNIGYAVHIYPGYWGGILNYQAFLNGWNTNVKPIADIAPIVVTETDWAPEGYGTFGTGTTGTAGGDGFGANLKYITDQSGNVSWNVLAPDNLLDHGDPNGGIAYNNDWQACAAPVKQWFSEYAGSNIPAASCGGSGTPYRLRARSTDGQGQVNFIINNETIATFTLSSTMSDYTVNSSATGDIFIQFDNDASGRDVQIDYLSVDGELRQAEDQSDNTGVWQDGSCGGSYSEWLSCNGSIAFGSAPSSGGEAGLVNNGVYEIEFQTDSNKVLDLRYGEDVNGGVLRPWNKNGATAQQWIAVDAGNGYWRFVSRASSANRCIDLQGGNTSSGTSIKLWDNYGNDAQAWQVTSVGDGYYKIVSKLDTNRGWDVLNCNMDGSQSLQLWDYYGTSCQLFKFNYIATANLRVTSSEDRNNSLKEEESKVFEVYPNPVSNGQFTISLTSPDVKKYRVLIFTVNGKQVFEQRDLRCGTSVIKTDLNQGIYILQVTGDNFTSMKKIIVK